MVALEAMALGLPIVGTPTDGLKDVVVNGKTGWLAENNAELSKYMTDILNNSALYDELSRNSKEKSLNDNNLGSYRALIRQGYCN